MVIVSELFKQWQLEDRQEAFNELTGIVALYLTDYRHVQLAIGGIKVDAEALAGERAGKPMKWTRPAVTSAVLALICVAGMVAAQPATDVAIQTSKEARATYLARAIIWRDPGALSAAEVLAGPVGVWPDTIEQAKSDAGIACTFARAGRELGGATAKFLCRTIDGQNLHLKYWNPESGRGNREVFATVAASRLMWALGFDAVAALSLNVRCDECPDNPTDGTGTRRTRRYIAMLQAAWPTPIILSGSDLNQGWSWRDLDRAIAALPTGPERARQRTHFDALTLLGVFIQHGDRKSEQQRLYCASTVETAGAAVAPKDKITRAEHVVASACATSAVTIIDVGATFGGAGRTSNGTTATMNLEEWKRKRVFVEANGNECRGELTVSLKAGRDGQGSPIISEEGRRFLVEQLHRLSSEHVRSIFSAARVDELNARNPHRAPDDLGLIDEWVTVFQDKVRQIEARRCQPAR